MVTCWEGAGLLALLCMMFSCAFVTFPYGYPGSGVVLDYIDSLSLPFLYLAGNKQEMKCRVHEYSSMNSVRLESANQQFQIKHSTTESLCPSLAYLNILFRTSFDLASDER